MREERQSEDEEKRYIITCHRCWRVLHQRFFLPLPPSLLPTSFSPFAPSPFQLIEAAKDPARTPVVLLGDVGMRRVDTAGESSCGRWISVLVWSHG